MIFQISPKLYRPVPEKGVSPAANSDRCMCVHFMHVCGNGIRLGTCWGSITKQSSMDSSGTLWQKKTSV